MFGGRNSHHSYQPVSSSNGGNHNFDSDEEETDSNDFIQQHIRQQQLEMKRQDEGLEMLSQSADRLSQLSLGISEELGQQNKLLDEMEEDLDKATSNLQYVTTKTRELIKKSGGKKNFLVIVGLTLIVLVLFFLVIYS